MRVTQMPPEHAANLVANSGNTAYGIDVIAQLVMGEHLTQPNRIAKHPAAHHQAAHHPASLQCTGLVVCLLYA